MKKRALISVTNKSGLEKFARLHDTGQWEFISTGGTAKVLADAGIPYLPIDKVTGFPEMMDGRLKTLHPKVFGGTLANRTIPKHLEEARRYGIELIDLVVVNFYEFDKTPGIENIDIGGPAHIRSAAKNAQSVTVVIDPNDYDQVIGQILEFGEVIPSTRAFLAIKAFRHTADYDAMITKWLVEEIAAGHDVFGEVSTSSH